MEAALAQVRGLADGFAARMTGTRAIPIADRTAGLVEVKSWRYAPSYRRRAAPLSHGWFVPTPAHPAVVVHVDTSAGGGEQTGTIGLAVTTTGALHPVRPPTWFEMDLFGPDVSTNLDALARHTHGQSAAADPPQVVAELASLLDAAAAAPIGLQKRLTKREYRQAEKDTYRYRDEQIYGPGGLAAYRKRMYGK